MPKRPERGVALVIGGGSGIGRAICLELARRGFAIIVAGRRSARLASVVSEVQGLDMRGLAAVADVTSDGAIQEMYGSVRGFTNELQALVNCAGDAFLGGVEATDPSQFEALVAVGLVGPYRAVFHGRDLLERARGHVVNVVSRSGRQPYADALAYGSTKAGLVYLTRSLSLALAGKGIRVNAVSPGAVDTELRRRLFPHEDTSRLMRPETVATCIGALLESDMQGINGAVIDLPW